MEEVGGTEDATTADPTTTTIMFHELLNKVISLN